MGGTSTDVCLCDGSVPFTSEWTIGEMPVRLPAVDVHTVGAGGGSIARIDEGGALRVGPQSAGADPGPAAYGRGGPATTTDAHLVLGRLGGASLLGGGFPVDVAAARKALASLGFRTVEDAAQGIIEVANAVMTRAMRVVSVERGHDPAEFALVAFGGAGPLHACELAEALGIPRVLVPPHPGLMSAIGMTRADTTRDYAAPLLMRHAADQDASGLMPLLQERVAVLEARARQELERRPETELSIDMRYESQGHELSVSWDHRDVGDLLEAYHALHQLRYGHQNRERAVELITLRLRARLRREAPGVEGVDQGDADAGAAKTGHRRVHLAQDEEVPLYARERLRAGNVIRGLAIVEQVDSTTLVSPGWLATVDRSGALMLTRERSGS
jgi:N-methylhydantoinase A